MKLFDTGYKGYKSFPIGWIVPRQKVGQGLAPRNATRLALRPTSPGVLNRK